MQQVLADKEVSMTDFNASADPPSTQASKGRALSMIRFYTPV